MAVPKSIKSILVATDLSPRTDRAMRRAVQLARSSKAKLTILHVVDDELPEAVAAQVSKAAQSELRQQIAEIPGSDTLSANICIAHGHDYKAILEFAGTCKADLIVLGMHRVRPVADIVFGTIPARVARYGTTPVLVVRNAVHAEYRQVLVGADFSPACHRAAQAALVVAPQASIRLVHAYHFPFSGFLRSAGSRLAERQKHETGLGAELEKQLTQPGIGKAARARFQKPVILEGAATEVISNAVRSMEAELLVLGTRGRNTIGATALGSLASGFLNNPPCDVLAVPPPTGKS